MEISRKRLYAALERFLPKGSIEDGLPLFVALYILFTIQAQVTGPERHEISIALVILCAIVAGAVALVKKNHFIYYTALSILSLLMFAVGLVLCAIAAVGAPQYIGFGLLIGSSILVLNLSQNRKFFAIASSAPLFVLALFPLNLAQVEYKVFSIAYSAIAVWLIISFKSKSQKRSHPLVLAIMIVSLLLIPLKRMRYIPPTNEQAKLIFSQPDVEVIFTNQNSAPIPRYRKELLCDPQTGIRIVSPHEPSNIVAFLLPDGEKSYLNIRGEAPDKTFVRNGIWNLVVEGDYVAIDLAEQRIVAKFPVCQEHAYYVNYRQTLGLALIDEDKAGDNVHLVDPNELGQVRHLPIVGNQSLFLSDELVIFSQANGIYTFNLRNSQSILRLELPRYGKWNQITIDYAGRRLYAPSIWTGYIYIVDLDSFKELGGFYANPGVRNVLLDPGDSDRLFSWNYATGEVLEHQLPGGAISRRWILGPVLRTLNWDCDGNSLLAATAMGGFRILLGAIDERQ